MPAAACVAGRVEHVSPESGARHSLRELLAFLTAVLRNGTGATEEGI